MKKNGFTLIEMMISVAIAGILSAVILQGMGKYIKEQGNTQNTQNIEVNQEVAPKPVLAETKETKTWSNIPNKPVETN